MLGMTDRDAYPQRDPMFKDAETCEERREKERLKEGGKGSIYTHFRAIEVLSEAAVKQLLFTIG